MKIIIGDYFSTYFWHRLLGGRTNRQRVEALENIEKYYNETKKLVDVQMEELLEHCVELEKKWLNDKEVFYNTQNSKNHEVKLLETNYLKGDKLSIEKYSSKLLYNLKYSNQFKMDVGCEYNPESRIIIIDYLLPTVDLYPDVKEIKFIKTKNEHREVMLSPKEKEKLYEDSIYSIILNSLSQIFKNDSIGAFDAVIFNGWTDSIDRSIGKSVKTCVTSIHCSKEEFLKLNLYEVDPKSCFKSLKGIAVHNLTHLTSIKPIATIEQADKRVVDSKTISFDSTTNLASMNWEDFEHLIREIFEYEFGSSGGTVKVTQASRDGGVDAIAFDPDPIKGGKIVIQAKRYTNIVGVSSVRDLYGTVLNEGAIKGILVTTSDFGSDSFEFAKNKPITLINGGNLLMLLEKHGFRARINLAEAKEEQKKNKR